MVSEEGISQRIPVKTSFQEREASQDEQVDGRVWVRDGEGGRIK